MVVFLDALFSKHNIYIVFTRLQPSSLFVDRENDFALRGSCTHICWIVAVISTFHMSIVILPWCVLVHPRVLHHPLIGHIRYSLQLSKPAYKG